ncbi:MAG: prolyl oligopeptidase family serine peptidase [Bdellovibrionaceae bacterium]|nr:prolyl oligopeptidase family serine peptidase [Pseudobdellovibrionaceae bacterium]
MQSKPIEKSYLDWEPVLNPEEVFQQTVGFTYLSTDEIGRLFWVENRPEENGRSVLVTRTLSGDLKDVTPMPFSVRSRVFEYGGSPYIVSKDWVYFVNLGDQRIYKTCLNDLDAAPTPLTVEKTKDGNIGKFADLAVSPDGRWLAFAYEEEIPNNEAINEVGLIDLQNPAPQESRTLVSGANFYKSPKFSPDGKSLAWLEWNHPFMPWDSTLLFEASFENGKVYDREHVAGSESSSISNIGYLNSGELIFGADFAKMTEVSSENFYNLYGYILGKIRAITNELMDFQNFRCDSKKIFGMALKLGKGRIVEVNPIDGKIREIKTEAVAFSVPVPSDGKLFIVGVMAKGPTRILEIDETGNSSTIKISSSQKINEFDVSEATAISFSTEDGDRSYGYFYPPINSHFKAPLGEKPPVRVLVHGGPTGMTNPGFSKQLLFWTSQGFAVFDVNYRGSFGFGRNYRDALLGKWGILEIQDVKDGLKYLLEQNLISNKAVVSGGSAGGYTVQRLLTFYPDIFAAGASHFGIGNLVTLQKLTHKYESHYLEQLIGGTLTTNLAEYEDRSPINHLTKLKSPMIIFQGSDDKVVPPENSREMAEILRKKGISYEYYEYPGEDHGFKKKENLVDALDKESNFFKKTLRCSEASPRPT